MLEGRGAILDVARDITRVLREADLDGAIIGGVAVVLHGHLRTTADVDVYVSSSLEPVRDALIAADYTFDAAKKEFVKDNVPVHLVTPEQVRFELSEYIEIDNILTVCLADLINMKLETGLNDPLRAQDMADVIGLIRHHQLTGEFSPRINKSVRKEFQKLIKAIGT